MKISEAFNLYLNDYILCKNQSVSIQRTHDFAKRTLIAITEDKEIESLTLEDVNCWRTKISKNKGPNTARGYIIRLRLVLNYISIRNIKCLDYRLIPLPKLFKNSPAFLQSEEIDTLISHAERARDKFIISLLYSSGIRISELISLDRGQIQQNRFTVIGKGQKPRLCFIDERTECLMDEYLATRHDNGAPLIVPLRGTPRRLSCANVEFIVRQITAKAGIHNHVTPHTLRHSFATNFLQNNGNMRYLADLLGHTSLNTTQMYAHVVNNDLQNAYEKYHTF